MALNRTVEHIRLKREDLSDYLYHFTKNKEAFETLVSILHDGKLKDIGGKGVICFTEAPFPMLAGMFDVFRPYLDPMYAPYGIGIRKEKLFALGGRPVIYGSPDEKELLDPKLQWRFQSYHPVHCDYSWLREWRIPVAEVELLPEDCFVITDQEHELTIAYNHEDIIDIEPDVDIGDDKRPVVSMLGKIQRQYKGISLETIKKIAHPNNAAVADELLSQSFVDMGYVNLGHWCPDQ